ncbi:MAG TPA: DHH family phosphoesterase [Candidatus Saccharimonadales bacterium]|nr:DHH family phosphoesterase [Candidatus Saccharimonadales bacterium]
MYKEAEKIRGIIDGAGSIVIIQADNPDTDSLASALALESILGDLGKTTHLYCGVDLPGYLHYLPGWGRVSRELPKQFDASIIVDTASDKLLEKLQRSGAKGWVAAKPTIVLDHHKTGATIGFADVICSAEAVATGEIVYELAKHLGWNIDGSAMDLIAMAILSDSLGLMSEATTARSIRIIAELVESGVKLPQLESARRETLKREPELISYKGKLLQRVEFAAGGKLALVTIPWEEIERYSPLYNPSMLVIDDMRLAKGTEAAVAFKLYKDGKITAKIRCNYGWGIADKLAEHFGGGGHPLASGFKITDGRPYEEIKSETINITAKLLMGIEEARANEAV